MPKCKSCGAEIRFLETKTGSLMPVDVPPARVLVEREGNGQTWYGLVDGYTSHFATCPNAAAHRCQKENPDAT
jgi:hypothetical protein